MIQGDASLIDTIGRLLILGFFLTAGMMNLAPARVKDHVERMAAFGVPFPAAAFWFGMALQFTGIALLATGWHAEIGAWCLIVFTVVANAIFHRFWTIPDPARRGMVRLLLMNGVAILGGLVLLLQNVR